MCEYTHSLLLDFIVSLIQSPFNLYMAIKDETPILWPPYAKNWLIGKDPDAGRDWGQEEKGMTEDEMSGWHHRLDGHEFEQSLRVAYGQGGLTCCNSWGRKESDTTEWLNWTELIEHLPQDSMTIITILMWSKENKTFDFPHLQQICFFFFYVVSISINYSMILALNI